MATYAQVRAERKRALQGVRRAERALDTQIEVMERRLASLKRRKTILTSQQAAELGSQFSRIVVAVNGLERALTDFAIVVTT